MVSHEEELRVTYERGRIAGQARVAALEAENADLRGRVAAMESRCKRLAEGFAGELDLAVHLGAKAAWRRCPDDEIDCPETGIHADAIDALREWAVENGWSGVVSEIDRAALPPPPAKGEA